MPATPFAGIGTQLQIGTVDSPSSFVAVARVRGIEGPNITTEREDITTLDSTGGYKEYRSTLKDGGEFTLDLLWIKSNTQQLTLRNAVDSGATLYGRIVGSDSPNTICRFAFIVTAFGMSWKAQNVITASLTLKMTGEPTWS